MAPTTSNGASPANDDSQEETFSDIYKKLETTFNEKREIRRADLRKGQSNRKREVTKHLAQRLKDHETAITKEKGHRRTQVEKMMSLLQRRNDLEKRIAESTAKLERAYKTTSDELQAVIAQRVSISMNSEKIGSRGHVTVLMADVIHLGTLGDYAEACNAANL